MLANMNLNMKDNILGLNRRRKIAPVNDHWKQFISIQTYFAKVFSFENNCTNASCKNSICGLRILTLNFDFPRREMNVL